MAFAWVLIEVTKSNGDPADSPAAYETVLPPGEFLYLNGAKILTYLSELEGGESGSVHKLAKEVSELKGSVSAGGFDVGAVSQHETSAESTLVRTEAAELGLLLRDLKENRNKGVDYRSVDLEEPGALAKIREGELVRFVTSSLTSPGYIRPYVVVHGSATFGALFPRRFGNAESARRAEEQGHRAKAFVRQIGPNPRLAFRIDPPAGGGEVPAIMLPLEYGGLTSERSLLEKDRAGHTGGRVVVYGKVARVFAEREPCEGGDDCASYTDYATREVWRTPLEQASNYLIEHVSHNCRSEAGDGMSGRHCFLAELSRETELSAPGAVIVPIAIVK